MNSELNIKVRDASLFTAAENGVGGNELQPVYVNTQDGLFSIPLSKWVAGHADGQVIGPSLSAVCESFESINDQYSRQRLAATGKPGLILWVDGHSDGPSAGVSMQMEDAIFGADGNTYTKDGEPVVYDFMLLQDTPEVRAKAQVLIDSVAQAWAVMEGLPNAADPTAYLLAITDRFSVPQQLQLPLSDTPDSAPALAGVTEDDDL